MSEESGRRSRREPVSVERSVEEGLLIARFALTMGVKNYIIVGAIRDKRPYDHSDAASEVRLQLAQLAGENEESAVRVRMLAEDVLAADGPLDVRERYDSADHPALVSRGVVYERLARELQRLSGDDDYIDEIVSAARADAWAEVGDAIEARLLRDLPRPPDRFYEDDKEARIRALLKLNLGDLERRKAKREQS